MVTVPPFQSVSGPHRGPYFAENLELFLIHGPNRCAHPFLSLSEALEQKLAVVHETGKVRELEIENLSPDRDLLILAGEVVKGGRQDRCLGVDLVVPGKSPRTKIPAFCVEQRRWAPRRGENASSFSSSSSMLAKEAMLTAKLERSQQSVWRSVQSAHAHLSKALAVDVASPTSPSSYQLMMENDKLRERQAEFRAHCVDLVASKPDTIGFAFAIGGQPSSADLFCSKQLASAYLGKLVDAALVTALAEGLWRKSADVGTIGPEEMGQWLTPALNAGSAVTLEVPPRLRIEQCEYGNKSTCTAFFGSLDYVRGVYVHRSWSTRSSHQPLGNHLLLWI